MINSILRFAVALIGALAVCFGVQVYIQDAMGIGGYERHIFLNYGFNFGITLIFYVVLEIFYSKKSSQLGFIFMFSSLIKFLLFFVLLYPGIKDSPFRGSESVSFFVPYGVSLILEILFLVKILNKEKTEEMDIRD